MVLDNTINRNLYLFRVAVVPIIFKLDWHTCRYYFIVYDHGRLMLLFWLGYNDTSTLVGHFVSSPRKRQKRDRRDRGDEREGQVRKRNRNESEESEEIKNISPLPLPATRIAALPNWKPTPPPPHLSLSRPPPPMLPLLRKLFVERHGLIQCCFP